MNRRTCLVGLVAAIAGVAGCTQTAGSEADEQPGEYQGAPDSPAATFGLGMIRISDTEITRQITYVIDGGAARTEQIATEVVTNGSSTVEAAESPLELVENICYRNTVYRLSTEVTDSQAATRYLVEIDAVADDVPDSAVVAYEDLPAVDRGKIAQGVVGTGTNFVYTETEQQESALVPTPTKSVVRWESGTRARVTVRKHEEVDTQATYHYSVSEIGTAAEYGAAFRQQHEFELTGLSAAEQEIVERAINVDSLRVDSYYPVPAEEGPEATPTQTVRRLVDRFRAHREKGFMQGNGEPSNGVGGYYLVRFEGQTYYTHVELDENEFEVGNLDNLHRREPSHLRSSR